MTQPRTYVIATKSSRFLAAFERHRERLPGIWVTIGGSANLDVALLERLAPRYIFFPHWSWIVPASILSSFECVCFHMTDLPYGRGGSPLQNLIVRGHKDTKLSALKMTAELDAGPIYMKAGLSLDGTAQDILDRAYDLSARMICEIVADEPVPSPQAGSSETFKRRTPSDSLLPQSVELLQLYDHIRMLDADGYPRAFIAWGDMKISLDQAKLADGKLVCRATIEKKD